MRLLYQVPDRLIARRRTRLITLVQAPALRRFACASLVHAKTLAAARPHCLSNCCGGSRPVVRSPVKVSVMVTSLSRRPAASVRPAAAASPLLLALVAGLLVVASAYNVDYETDLASLCSGASGTSSGTAGEVLGCRLWRLCKDGEGSGDYCQPATLLATACAELQDAAECKKCVRPISDAAFST